MANTGLTFTERMNIGRMKDAFITSRNRLGGCFVAVMGLRLSDVGQFVRFSKGPLAGSRQVVAFSGIAMLAEGLRSP